MLRVLSLFLATILSLFFVNCSTSNKLSDNITHNCFKYVFAGNVQLLSDQIKECVAYRNADRITVLMMAALKGNDQMVELLIKNGSDVNAQDLIGQNSLSYAIIKNNVDTVGLLVQHGARIVSNEYGITSLMTAVQMGKPELVRALEPDSISINMRTYEGWSALYFAVRGGKREIFDYLIERGACTEMQDNLRQTPLQFARELGWWHAQNRLQKSVACR